MLKSLRSKRQSLIYLISKTELASKRSELKGQGRRIDEEICAKEKEREKFIKILEIRAKGNEKRQEKKGIAPKRQRTKDVKKDKLRRALRKYEIKKQNLVKDLHFKAACMLVNNCNRIYLGNLSTKKIVSRNNVTISKNTKKTILALAPYKFKQILKHMGNRYGCKVEEVSEYLSTKTCSSCGNMYEIGRSKVYKCKKCRMEADRDENSAKTHLKLGLMKEILAVANSRRRNTAKDTDRIVRRKLLLSQCPKKVNKLR
jgi:putative transposase